MNDWKARAEREAAAIVYGIGFNSVHSSYESIVRACAIAWIQGMIYQQHGDLSGLETALDELRAAV